MKFLNFLNTCEVDDLMEMDFVKDANSAWKFPDPKTWSELRSYLNRRNACSEAIEAGKSLWKKYESAHGRDIAA